MTASSVSFDFAGHCPSCGGQLDSSGATVCQHCSRDFLFCSSCGATNRLLIRHCRACGAELTVEACPLRTVTAGAPALVGADRLLQLGAHITSQMIAADGLVVVALADCSIAILSEARRREIGRVRLHGLATVAPALNRGMLFAAAGNTIVAFDLARNIGADSMPALKPAWSCTLEPGSSINSLLFDDDSIYPVVQNSHQTMIESVSMSTRARMWPAPVTIDSRSATPLLTRDSINLLTLSGELWVVQKTGRVVGKVSLERRLSPQIRPQVVGGSIFFIDTDHALNEVCLEARSTSTLYSHGSRALSFSASEELIAIGHLAGLTLLNSRGQRIWSNDNLESISMAPVIAGSAIFAVDDLGWGMVFDCVRATPSARVRLLSGDINVSPVLTRTSLVAANSEGEVAIAALR